MFLYLYVFDFPLKGVKTIANRGTFKLYTVYFTSKKDCETVCKSFVNNGFGCKLILGVPWNSYSTAKTCKKHS